METNWHMLLHSILLGTVAFFIMVYGLGQRFAVAERRSMLLAACVFIYMILFGHKLPTKLPTL